jgi:PAS domain S-box-containing protein
MIDISVAHSIEVPSELFFESSVDCVKVLDVEGHLLQMNRNGQCMMEIADFERIRGAFWVNFWPEETRTIVQAELVEAREKGTGHFSAFCPTAKGTPKVWDVIISPIYRSGVLEGFLSVSRDITHLQQTIDALNQAVQESATIKVEKERRASFASGQQKVLELAVSGAPIAMVLAELAETAELHAGHTVQASVLLTDDDGKHLRVGAAPSLPESFNQAIDGIAVGAASGACGTAAFTKRPVFIHDVQSDPLCVGFVELAEVHSLRSCWSQPILSSRGEVLGTFAFYCRESRAPSQAEMESMAVLVPTAALILERHHEFKRRATVEHALKESEAKFRTIANAMPQMVWSTLPDGYHDYYNDQWYAFTGVPYGSTDGDEWNGVFHPDDQERAWKLWRHCLATGVPYEIEYRLRHRSGEYRWTLGRALAQRDDSGRITRWMGTCTDIHEHRLTQEALRESNKRKDEFLAMLAHELRNPLAPISSAASLLLINGSNQAQVQRISAVISRQARHMTGLIEDLLDVSRVTRGQITLEKESSLLHAIVSEAIEQIRPAAEARHHNLAVEMPPPGAQVCGDKKRLVQVIANLLSNAVRYTPDSGEIELRSEVDGDQVVLTVRDNGIGMSSDLTERAFELFVQGERSSDRSQGGLGIGLALVKSLVALHGGSVSAHSAGLGLGSEFKVRLPLLHNKSNDGPLSDSDGISRTDHGLDILIVDDNVDAAEILGMVLEAAGHTVHLEHSPLRALDYVRTATPDVCLLDIGLPEISGIELARRLRQLPALTSSTLIALSGYGQPQDHEASLSVGFSHHLVKPVDMAHLEALLDEVSKGTLRA